MSEAEEYIKEACSKMVLGDVEGYFVPNSILNKIQSASIFTIKELENEISNLRVAVDDAADAAYSLLTGLRNA